MNSDAVKSGIESHITSKLNDLGLMFRIFSRTKSKGSIERKIHSDSRYGAEKKIQDLIGLRVVLYFADDIDTVRAILFGEYSERSSDVSIDEVRDDEFKATRYNIVYSLPSDDVDVLSLGEYSEYVDQTFELQIRTIFSEGWHEVEHDLRYKCKGDWDGFEEQSRRLNGVYASLETSEWTMIKIFDELSYRHYKNKDWSSMFRQKFRMRFVSSDIDVDLLEIFQDDEALVKRFFRLDRNKLILEMNKNGFYYPISLSNLIYFSNFIKIKDKRILDITPGVMVEDLVE